MMHPIPSDMRPRRREGVDYHVLDDEAVVYDVARDAVHYLNATARYIWDRCDGRHTIEEIGRGVIAAFEADPPDDAVRACIPDDVGQTLRTFVRHALIEIPPVTQP